MQPRTTYGTIRVYYIYAANGQPIINQTGSAVELVHTKNSSNNVIGESIWKAGLNNSINLQNLNLSFLLDMQKGGDVFSLDTCMVTLQDV
jgi:hypothetical protein